MRLSKLSIIIALSTLLLASLPAFADSWTTIPQPNSAYTSGTTNFGGGDGSLGFISSLGPFTFSSPLSENNVPNSWATWNCPPATESCTPNVLFTDGVSSLTITTSDIENTMGFELEPDQYQQELVQATFHSSTGDSFPLSLNPNGSAGALLFAVQDTTAGAHITSVDIVDTAGDDFAIAQLRDGESCSGCCGLSEIHPDCGPPVPEPATMALLGTGLLGALGVMWRKLLP